MNSSPTASSLETSPRDHVRTWTLNHAVTLVRLKREGGGETGRGREEGEDEGRGGGEKRQRREREGESRRERVRVREEGGDEGKGGGPRRGAEERETLLTPMKECVNQHSE